MGTWIYNKMYISPTGRNKTACCQYKKGRLEGTFNINILEIWHFDYIFGQQVFPKIGKVHWSKPCMFPLSDACFLNGINFMISLFFCFSFSLTLIDALDTLLVSTIQYNTIVSTITVFLMSYQHFSYLWYRQQIIFSPPFLFSRS